MNDNLLLPWLSNLYRRGEPWGYTLLRIAAGAMMAVYGYAKLFNNGVVRDTQEFHQLGLEPAAFLAYFVGVLDFFGGLLLVVGLLTRPLAGMLFVQWAIIACLVAIPRGINFQLSMVFLAIFLYILLRGGDRISADRVIGKEL